MVTAAQARFDVSPLARESKCWYRPGVELELGRQERPVEVNLCLEGKRVCSHPLRLHLSYEREEAGQGGKGMRRKGQAAVTTRRDTARREACVSRKKWFHHTHAHEERPAASCFQTISTDLRPRSHTTSAPTVYATRPLRSTKP